MADLPSATELANLAAVLAPGIIILGIRSRFKEGPPTELKDSLVSYAVTSTAYYAAAFPVFHADNGVELWDWLWRLLQYFLIPGVVALGVVALEQGGWLYKAAKKLGFKLTHHIPAAWDYAFSGLRTGTYVLVKLTDGTQYAGKMGKQSFASSASAERDLYIEEVWSVRDQGSWALVQPKRSVLLCGKDIRWVEIFERSSG